MRLLTKAGLGLAILLVSVAFAPAAKADPITIQSGNFALQGLGNNGTIANGMDDLIGATASIPHTVNRGFDAFSVAVNVIPKDIVGPGAPGGVFWSPLKAEFTGTSHHNPVPEPATLSLLGLGIAGVAAKIRQRRRKLRA